MKLPQFIDQPNKHMKVSGLEVMKLGVTVPISKTFDDEKVYHDPMCDYYWFHKDSETYHQIQEERAKRWKLENA